MAPRRGMRLRGAAPALAVVLAVLMFTGCSSAFTPEEPAPAAPAASSQPGKATGGPVQSSESEVSPTGWVSAPGGHHRTGRLIFAHPDKTTTTFELVIRNVAGVSERVLRWGA